jgi:O-antigen ligase/polysaccharide polymerase Wzy-like membrane protein
MTLRLFGSFALPAIASFALTLNASAETLGHTRLGPVLVILVLLHLLRNPRILFCREFALYFILVGYMIVALLWTADIRLAIYTTLLSAIDFLLILILFGALVTYHDFRAVLAGTLGGFLIGAAFFTFTQGFPFVFPKDLSYNAVSIMYVSGLFVTLLFGWYTRLRVLPLAIGLLLLLHIVATTSIKSNLGIVLGATAAGLIYFRPFLRVLRRIAIPLIALAGMIAYAVVSNDELVTVIERGVERVGVGSEILLSGTDTSAYGALTTREIWADAGLTGWIQKPLFGHGVEAFRDRYGTTSHSTPVDLLYNHGLIALVLFYGLFISVAWRLFRARDPGLGGLHALIFGALVCYLFISLSGTLHYNPSLAVFFAISTAILRQQRRKTSRAGVFSRTVR